MEKWNVIDFRTHLFKLQHDQIKLSEWLFTVVVTVIVIILVIVFVWPFDILWDRILSILNVLHPVIKVPIRSYILQILPARLKFSYKLYHIMLHRVHLTGVNKSPSPTPGASNFHIWASWNNQLYARRASKNIYRILTNLSIFAYLLIFIYVICCLISSNVLFIQPLAFCRNWEQRR